MVQVTSIDKALKRRAKSDKLQVAVLNAERVERQIAELKVHQRFNLAENIQVPEFDIYMAAYKDYRCKVQRQIRQLKD